MTFHPTPTQSAKPAAKSNDYAVPHPGSDGISSLSWSPISNSLVSSNWDSTVSFWDVRHSGSHVVAIPKAQVFHAQQHPSLCTCFSSDGKIVFSGGVDNAVRMWDVEAGVSNAVQPQMGIHEKPVKAVVYVSSSNLVASGSWDHTVKFWDTRSSSPSTVLKLPGRVYAMDCVGKLLAVGTSDNQTTLYDVSSAQPRLISRKPTLAEYDQIRCIAIAPDQKSVVVGGIGGRTKVYDLTSAGDMKRRYSFKCHFEKDNAYPVNSISFQGQSCDVVATAGSNGMIKAFDILKKKHLQSIGPKDRSIACAAFNAPGNLLAYASSYDWSKGSMYSQPGNEIFLHIVS